MPLSLSRLAPLALSLALMTGGAQAGPPVMQPGSVELPAKTGERHRQVLTVTNPGGEDHALTVGLANWTLDRDGRLRLAPPGDNDNPVLDWVRFTPAYLSLPPGESGQIVVDVIAPDNLLRAGDYRFALMASSVAPDAQTGRMEKTELSSLFYVTVAPAVSDAVVSDVRLQRSGGTPPHLELDLTNSGNAHARLEGKILIEGHAGEPVILPVSNLVVLEGQQRRFSIPVKTELPEEPRVTVRLDDIFAPQTETGVAPIREYSAPLDGAPLN